MKLTDITLNGSMDDTDLFNQLLSKNALLSAFSEKFSKSPAKGVDRINGFQFANRAEKELEIASSKCLNGSYRFSPFLENLKNKGRNKYPRIIGIPTIRDRVVLHQLHRFLALTFPDRTPKNIASRYVKEIATDLKAQANTSTWVCSTDIKTFYDDIPHSRLINQLKKRTKCVHALKLVTHALNTPTVPKNCKKSLHPLYRQAKGVPQGLSISNILASIYMQDIDEFGQGLINVKYYRYVDDVLIYGEKKSVQLSFTSLKSRLAYRGLKVHSLSSGKSNIANLSQGFSYLGYVFMWPKITVRDSTVERFLQSIAAKFSEFKHNKSKRLERLKYLTEERLKDIFLLELNEKITGAISTNKRYGWIAYFNEITDQSLLYRMDLAIVGMFSRLPEFQNSPPDALRKLTRAYFEMKYNPSGGYVRNYDLIKTRAQKLQLLEERGRIDPAVPLSDAQIDERYDSYVQHIISSMHADEGVIY